MDSFGNLSTSNERLSPSPFKNIDVERLINLIIKKNLLEENGIIVLHRNKTSKENFPNKFKIIDERIYGLSRIIFGKILI